MKLITLNLWGGKVLEALLDFIARQSDVDIFCFQEDFFGMETFINKRGAHTDLHIQLQKILRDHIAYKAPVPEGSYWEGQYADDIAFGEVIFVKNNLNVSTKGQFPVYESNSWIASDKIVMSTGNFQYLVIKDKADLLIGNLHGLWQADSNKMDTDERIYQSQKVKNFVNGHNGPTIIVGDFNLHPDTESVSILDSRMINHVRENKIISTRSELYKKDGKFADYILTSPQVNVKEFKVIDECVSDHLPLFIEFDLS